MSLLSGDHLDAGSDHKAEGDNDSKVHHKGAKDSCGGSSARVANREGETTNKDDALDDQGGNWVDEGSDKGSQQDEMEVLKEVDLAALAIRHIEPVGIRELLAIATIASVRVAELGSSILSWESLSVLGVELRHELTVESLYPRTHSHSVHSDNVLEDDSEG